MKRGRRVCGVVMMAALLATAAPAADYDFERDFSTTVNPNGAWSYLFQSNGVPNNLMRDGSYELLPTHDAERWYANLAPNNTPLIGIVRSGDTVESCLHPGRSDIVVVGWRAPSAGKARISWEVADRDGGGGNGVVWYVDLRTATAHWKLASGTVENGGRTDMQVLPLLAVSAGDRIFFVIDPNGEYSWDSTRLVARVEIGKSADVINFDVNGHRSPEDPSPARTYTGAVMAVSSGAYWNSGEVVNGVTNTWTASRLRLADGVTVTPVSFTMRAVSDDADARLSADAVTNDHRANMLLQDYVLVSDSPGLFAGAPRQIAFSFSGLRAGQRYDVVLYSSIGDWDTGGRFTVGGQTRGSTGGWRGGFVPGLNFVVFPAVTADATGTIAGTLDCAANRLFGVFNGFQIVGPLR
jgi:hypothetical protein